MLDFCASKRKPPAGVGVIVAQTNGKALLTSCADEQIVEAFLHLIAENPRAAAKLLQVLSNPPRIGSVRLSWRDGKLNAIEVVESVY